MKIAILGLAIGLFPLAANAEVTCDEIYYSADKSIVGKTVENGVMIDGQLILMTGCGTGLYCSYVKEGDKQIPVDTIFLNVGVFPGKLHYNHPTQGELVLQDTCHGQSE